MEPRTIVLAVVVLAGCSTSAPSEERSTPTPGVVLYTIGISTDPYGDGRPDGFGVAASLLGKVAKVEVRSPEYGWFGGAEWLASGHVLVHRAAPPLRRPHVFRFEAGRLERVGDAPFLSGTTYSWSPDRTLVALEPPKPCRPAQPTLYACYRSGGRIYVARADGSDRRFVANGTGPSWTRDGRLVFHATVRDNVLTGRAVVVDLETGRKTIRNRFWPNEQPLFSADGHYRADRRGVKEGTVVVVEHADGRPVAEFRTRSIVSMIAWSPRGHRLAYTTSGFPDPHELFVVDARSGTRRRLFASGVPHFDWVTWSPDGRWLLLDGDKAGGWRVFSAASGRQVRALPRLGGKPLWCCPVNAYDALGARYP